MYTVTVVERHGDRVHIAASRRVNRDRRFHVSVAARGFHVRLLVPAPLTSEARGRLHRDLEPLGDNSQTVVMWLAQHARVLDLGLTAAHFPRPQPAAPVPVAPLSRPVTRLLSSATDRLSPELRARYAAEFEADVRWIEGRWARLWFALCLRLWTAPRLRKAAVAGAGDRDVPRRA